MLYVIYAEDVTDSLEKRLAIRPQHLSRLEELKRQNRLLIAGANPTVDNDEASNIGFTGSVIIAEFIDLQQATEWINDDPYVKTGVYQNVIIKPFKRTF